MARKAGWCFVIVLMLVPLITGCWNRRELNDLAIVAALGIDRVKDKFLVTVQVVDPGEVASRQGSSGLSPVLTYHGIGDTVFEAVRKMTTVTPRKLYFSHLRVFIIGEELAREGMGEALDLMSRDQEGRTDFYIVVAKGTTAENVLKVLTPIEKIPASKMFDSLEVSERSWAPTVAVQLDELITNIVSPGIQATLTGVVIQGDPELGSKRKNVETPATPVHLQYKGIAMFREDKLIAWMNEDESKGFSNITDRLNSTVVKVACPRGGKLAIEVIRSKTAIKAKVRDGKPEAEVVMHTEANVADVECKIKLTTATTLFDLEKATEDALKMHAEKAVKKAQRLKCDIFGFGDAIHRANPRYWSKAKENWDQQFSKMDIRFNVDVKIRRIGTIGESFLNDMKE
ncbi:Ger(x)C family spore germination protein [Paenibacillus sp. 1011MAR3C5]|uniref:Ger(x)C family spore germination protein n=1 Tax=Paenibacillus sp. 1011MAR3C5 TaxID=1675787 RepID=UPI000E6D20F9|nr:Ger(x)C family spore germination protein [Paenibacillus sp. 1011MAR3C5]RJE86102.1 Ger(x)C family spore germination protein [Paenibacillus sp. 1011MAR3C5]